MSTNAKLKESGDEAWFYHNARGPYWTPEWSRLINGLYLWASPFTTHIPWTYQAYSDNPFDDTDGPAARATISACRFRATRIRRI